MILNKSNSLKSNFVTISDLETQEKNKSIKNVNKSISISNISANTSLLFEKFKKVENVPLIEMNKLLDNSKNIVKSDEECLPLFEKIKILEAKEVEINDRLNRMKIDELRRINNEFLLNDYERRFKVTQEEVISALVGEIKTTIEYIKQMKDQKVIYCMKKGLFKKNFDLQDIQYSWENDVY